MADKKPTTRYCERCGRVLKFRILRKHEYDTDTGERTDYRRKNYYCWFGLVFGRGNPYGIQHDNFLKGDWDEVNYV